MGTVATLAPKDLAAIRHRAKANPTFGLVVEHSEAHADRAALLGYIDNLDAEIKELGKQVEGILGMTRFTLAQKIVADGHAKNVREAIAMTKDLDKLATIYPEPSDD